MPAIFTRIIVVGEQYLESNRHFLLVLWRADTPFPHTECLTSRPHSKAVERTPRGRFEIAGNKRRWPGRRSRFHPRLRIGHHLPARGHPPRGAPPRPTPPPATAQPPRAGRGGHVSTPSSRPWNGVHSHRNKFELHFCLQAAV